MPIAYAPYSISLIIVLGVILISYFIYRKLLHINKYNYEHLLLEKETQYETLFSELNIIRPSLQQEHEKRIIAEEKANRFALMEPLVEAQRKELEDLKIHNASLHFSLKQEKEAFHEKVLLLEKAQREFQNAFKALSAEALAKNNQSFLDLAKTTLGSFQEAAKTDIKSTEKAFSELVTPVREALGTVNKRIEDMEKSRVGAYEGLKEQVNQMLFSQRDLRLETANLVKALRAPNIRGRWGEMQLRRVVEMSGMSPHCDFIEQAHLEGEEGRLRPDMIVNLPNKKQIIIDSKAPLAAYLEAIESQTDASRVSHLKNHARQVRTHINALSSRAYWDQFLKNGATPEFVVLFLPGDTFFSAALEHDPTLIEEGVQKKVIISTPATLIALLHTVALGWRQESLAENAKEISDLGKELYKRCADMGSHMAKLGRDLSAVVNSYNKTIGTIERRVLPSARKFKDLKAATGEEIALLSSIDHAPRDIQAIEMIQAKESV